MTRPTARGRRPGSPDTAAGILRAARARFLRGGQQAVTLRAVAADAGVDVALVSYHFGSKQGLVSAVLHHDGDPTDPLARAIDGGPTGLAERALHAVLAHWEDPRTGAPWRALIAAATTDRAVAAQVRELVETEVVDRLTTTIGGGLDARRRAGAWCAHLIGLVLTRYILRIEPLASLPAEQVVHLYAPLLRQSLDAATPHA